MAERQYRIHPAIGAARVGNAVRSDNKQDFYFIGPEFPEIPPNVDPVTGQQGDFKTDGLVKPQAVRFRIFEYEKGNDGKFHPIGEVKSSDAGRAVDIRWTVGIANRKASFCEIGGQAGAEDTPLFASYGVKAGLIMRNEAKVKTKKERTKWLELVPGPGTIKGGDTAAVVHFLIDHDLKQPKPGPGGETKLKIRTLGELRTDADGRLIFIGGMGQSDFDPGLGQETITEFNSNNGWYDDVSDGPVSAELTIDGAKHPVEGAWVLVGPPDFAPALRSYRTMYDSLVDVIVREMTIPSDDGLFASSRAHIAAMNKDWKQNKTIKDFKPSFTRDIAPLLLSVARMERVHKHQMGPKARYHGSVGELNFADLGGPGSLAPAREAVFERLRDPNTFDVKPLPKIIPSHMPAAYGDYYGAANGRGDKTDPAFLHAVSKLQFALLLAWKNGNFQEDWGQVPAAPPAISPEGLDRAALENMSGGAFYPGMEASWLFVKNEVWEKPFRIARNRKIGSVPVPGEKRQDLIVEAGVFTQQMALPWQADFMACAGDEETVQDPDVAGGFRRIAWWPTTRPDDVFSLDAPTDRRSWARVPDAGQPTGYREMKSFNEMANLWFTLGFVVEATPAGARKDLYEQEFNKSPPAAPLVAAAPGSTGTG